jgi:hypothetical protein
MDVKTSLSDVSVLCEQIVEAAKSRLEAVNETRLVEAQQSEAGRNLLSIDNIFRPSFGLWQTNVFHNIKGEGDIVNHLIGALGCEIKLVEWHKESSQQAHQQAQVDAILEISRQVAHFKVQLVQVLVDERYQRLLDDLQLLWCVIEERVKGVAFATHSDVVVGARDELLVFPKSTMLNANLKMRSDRQLTQPSALFHFSSQQQQSQRHSQASGSEHGSDELKQPAGAKCKRHSSSECFRRPTWDSCDGSRES